MLTMMQRILGGTNQNPNTGLIYSTTKLMRIPLVLLFAFTHNFTDQGRKAVII